MELADTHCHIQSIGLKKGERITRELWAKADDLTADGVVNAAVGHGVTRLICVGCDLEDSRLAIDFVQDRPNCWASIGIHPHEARHTRAAARYPTSPPWCMSPKSLPSASAAWTITTSIRLKMTR
jgi:Tat protein secretion system quality control protein TatD with DNase activity